MSDQSFVVTGVLLIVIGVVLAFLVIVIPAARSGKLSARGGAVILIGPFPIVFGSDRQTAKALLVLAIVLVALMLVLFLFQQVL